MNYTRTIELLEAKQQELDVLLEDKSKESSAKLSTAMWHDELTAAIEVLKRDAAKVAHDTLRVPIKWNREKGNIHDI